MDISFTNSRLRDICLSEKARKKEFGETGAKILKHRLEQLANAADLDQMRALPGHWHELKGTRWGQLAANLDGANRLVFEPDHNPIPTKPDGGVDWKRITAVLIIEITDYH